VRPQPACQARSALAAASVGDHTRGTGELDWPSARLLQLWHVTGREHAEEYVDEDLNALSREQLIEEVRKLRRGIRAHRDSTGQELCWHHPALWGLLPEKQDPLPTVPEWPEFLLGCVRYRQSLDEQAPDAPRSAR
jgi:hypothetical protein